MSVPLACPVHCCVSVNKVISFKYILAYWLNHHHHLLLLLDVQLAIFTFSPMLGFLEMEK